VLVTGNALVSNPRPSEETRETNNCLMCKGFNVGFIDPAHFPIAKFLNCPLGIFSLRQFHFFFFTVR
jgi:hypothetical protein